MMARLTALPLFVLLMGIGAVAMLLPALHSVVARGDVATARAFVGAAGFALVLTTVLGLATQGYDPRNVPRSQLTALLAAFAAMRGEPLFSVSGTHRRFFLHLRHSSSPSGP